MRNSLQAVVAILLAAWIGSCQSATRSKAQCPTWPVLYAPVQAFNLEREPPLAPDTAGNSNLSYAQRRALLRDAYRVNCCLEASQVRDSTYVGASFYATEAGLNRNPRAPCHVLVQASMDDFSGLFLVLRGPGPHYNSLYVAGTDGSGTTESGRLETARMSRGRMLNDSLVEVKTGNSTIAFRGTGDHSATDTLTEVFRIDFRTATFHLISSHNKTTPLNQFLN